MKQAAGRPGGWAVGAIVILVASACQAGTRGGATARPGAELTVEGAYAYAPPASGEVAVDFTVHNPDEAPDTLVHVNTPEAAAVMYHRNVTEGGPSGVHEQTIAVSSPARQPSG